MRFTPQLVMPSSGDPYYNTKRTGGFNPCILGNPQRRVKYLNVLPNCVGYATGRFNFIYHSILGGSGCQYLGNTNAARYIELAKKQGLQISEDPTLGGCMVWKGGHTNEGHVAIVELMRDGKIVTSESEYYGKAFTIYTRSGSNWSDGCYWMGSSYTYLGCIVNPAVIEEETVTYEQFCNYMDRYLKELSQKPADTWAEPAIEYCQQFGLMVGDPDGNFRPQSPIKREEMASILKGLITGK